MPSFSVGDQIDLEEGQYPARILSIAPAQIDPNRPRDPRFDKPQLVITYLLIEIEGEDGGEITRRQYVNEVQALTPRSTLYGLFSTIVNNGLPLDKSRQWDTDELIDKDCIIFWGAYRGEDGTEKMKILKVSAAKAAAAPAQGIRRKSIADDVAAV